MSASHVTSIDVASTVEETDAGEPVTDGGDAPDSSIAQPSASRAARFCRALDPRNWTPLAPWPLLLTYFFVTIAQVKTRKHAQAKRVDRSMRRACMRCCAFLQPVLIALLTACSLLLLCAV